MNFSICWTYRTRLSWWTRWSRSTRGAQWTSSPPSSLMDALKQFHSAKLRLWPSGILESESKKPTQKSWLNYLRRLVLCSSVSLFVGKGGGSRGYLPSFLAPGSVCANKNEKRGLSMSGIGLAIIWSQHTGCVETSMSTYCSLWPRAPCSWSFHSFELALNGTWYL